MEKEESLQLGNDLDAWKKDASFFDKEADTLAARILDDMSTLSVKAVSVEKDIRVRILDYEGELQTGEAFKIAVANEKTPNMFENYTDSDKDGVITIDKLTPGTYEVTLQPIEGYTIPSKPTEVVVKAKVEYSFIEDIALMFKEKSEAEVRLEDTMTVGADTYADKKQNASFAKDNYVYGIDVSEKNTVTDWKRVYDSGIRFVMIRAGYRGSISGDIVVDKLFLQNATLANRAGLDVGVYFFSQAVNEKEAVEEASAVYELCKEKNICYPICIRIDQAGGLGRADALDKETRTKVAEAFMETIKGFGYDPCVYASSNWLKTNIDMKKLSSYKIWMAQFNAKPVDDIYYDMWQYSSKGKVPGVEGEVYLSKSFIEN
ncbi:MAG: hypothetical protein IK152_03565 [Lachnospiraceae bacterium]|nr:hypothetical protein [Lachnospiraceae bacterium]